MVVSVYQIQMVTSFLKTTSLHSIFDKIKKIIFMFRILWLRVSEMLPDISMVQRLRVPHRLMYLFLTSCMCLLPSFQCQSYLWGTLHL